LALLFTLGKTIFLSYSRKVRFNIVLTLVFHLLSSKLFLPDMLRESQEATFFFGSSTNLYLHSQRLVLLISHISFFLFRSVPHVAMTTYIYMEHICVSLFHKNIVSQFPNSNDVSNALINRGVRSLQESIYSADSLNQPAKIQNCFLLTKLFVVFTQNHKWDLLFAHFVACRRQVYCKYQHLLMTFTIHYTT
jgi:hypothetical protein